MICTTRSDRPGDLLSRRGFVFLVYVIPVAALVLAGNLDVGTIWRTVIWSASLLIMGTGCIANAVRCGRTHCYLTGPFFLLMGLAAALYGLGILPLGSNGWNVIGLSTLLGGAILGCVPEIFLGKYRQRDAA